MSPDSAPPPESELLLETPRFSVVRKQRTNPAGQTYSREVVMHPGAVVIVPILNSGEICLIRNYRLSVDDELIELPAGTLEPGESPSVAAARELLEETGYRAKYWHQVMRFWMSPGILNERMYLYLAWGLTPGQAQLEPGEEIKTLPLEWFEIYRLMEEGQIKDAKTLTALLYVERFYDEWLKR